MGRTVEFEINTKSAIKKMQIVSLIGFAIGLAMMLSEWALFAKAPFSQTSIGLTVFGLTNTIVAEIWKH